MADSHDRSAPRYDDEPGSAKERRRYEPVRAPETGALRVIILAHYFTGVWTHWLDGRKQPCMKPACEACDHDLPKRWYGYVAVQGVKSGDIGFLEITPPVIETFSKYREKFLTCRGAFANVMRAKEKKNGKVVVHLRPSTMAPGEIPEAPDVFMWLNKIWGLGDTWEAPISDPMKLSRTVADGTVFEQLDLSSSNQRLKPSANGKGKNHANR